MPIFARLNMYYVHNFLHSWLHWTRILLCTEAGTVVLLAEKLNSLRKWVLPTRLSSILGNQRRRWCQLCISTESVKKFNLLEAESSFGNLHGELCHGQLRQSHLDYSWNCFGLARLFLIHQMLEFP